jgi:hypothetical protein
MPTSIEVTDRTTCENNQVNYQKTSSTVNFSVQYYIQTYALS